VEDQAAVRRRGNQGRSRAGALAFAASAGLCLAACGRGKDQETDDKLPPQVTLSGVTLHAWKGDELVALGIAEEVTYDRSSGNFEAAKARVRFPRRESTSDASPQLTSDLELSAAVAHGNLPTRQAEGRGGVIARSSSGLVARTSSARFDGQGQLARGEEPIEVIGPGYALDAEGFTFDLRSEDLVFEGAVQSRLGAAVTPR
jgi:lipopolysaccharide export system protein LptC